MPRRTNWRLIIALAVSVSGIVLALEVFFGGNNFEGVEQKTFTVYRGQSFVSIVDSLEVQGLIRNRVFFDVVGRVLGGTTKMHGPGHHPVQRVQR